MVKSTGYPLFFVLFVTAPANVVYEVCGKQNLRLGLNITKLVAAVLAVIIGYTYLHEAAKVLACFVAVSTLTQLGVLALGYKIVNNPPVREAGNKLAP